LLTNAENAEMQLLKMSESAKKLLTNAENAGR
jgi:hypothetical protein